MPKSRPPYPLEFRRQMIELVQAGRTPRELAQEFEPSYETIRAWVRQADRDEGRSASGLTTQEQEELRRLRRENRQLRVEREILAKAAALRFRRPARYHHGLRVRERTPGLLPNRHDVPCAGSFPQRVLRVAQERPIESHTAGRHLA